MNQPDLQLTQAFIAQLAGDPNAVCDFRVIHDTDKGEQGKNLRGTLTELAPTLTQYNQSGWGVFISTNVMDGKGYTLENVHSIRTHFADLDDTLTSQDAYNRAVASQMPPQMAVQTSSGKYHLYWLTEPYTGNDFFNTQQRKIIQLYNADKSIIDPTRVLRVPGFYHNKKDPHLVTCWQVSDRPRYTFEQIAAHLQHVNTIEHVGGRFELGDPSKAAPSLDWLKFALYLFDPNDMTREEWVPLTSAFKQSGWSLADEQTLLSIWLEWCTQYSGDDIAENMKLWNSIRNSETGWGRFERLSMVKAYINNNPTIPPDLENLQATKQAAALIPDHPKPEENPQREKLSEIIDADGKKIWFEDCYFIAREGKIFSPQGRFMNTTQFNGLYGGKEFTLKDAGGKVTDEPWKAALRATDWQIPKVDHVRFLPSEKPYTIVKDELGRQGLNTYLPARIVMTQSDVSIWNDFLNRILPTPDDVRIFNDYMGHCIRYPGHKIPWAVLLQSERGIGKQIIGNVVKYCVGESYTYEPDAEQLVSSASRFNGWMRNKLLIMVDEIRVGDRRDLLEGLKKIITDKRIAVESKGVDQEMEDNAANWLFFSNYKDAIPINENERRYAVFYSDLQSAKAIANAGMDKDYFDSLYHWLENQGGYAALAHYYHSYPIERGALPHRAPKTSSYDEVIRVGRSPLEILIDDRVAAGERGFHNGYISWPMLMKAIAESKMRFAPPEHAIKSALETKGYFELGYTAGPVGGEDIMKPSLLYGKSKEMSVEAYI